MGLPAVPVAAYPGPAAGTHTEAEHGHRLPGPAALTQAEARRARRAATGLVTVTRRRDSAPASRVDDRTRNPGRGRRRLNCRGRRWALAH